MRLRTVEPPWPELLLVAGASLGLAGILAMSELLVSAALALALVGWMLGGGSGRPRRRVPRR